VSYSFQNKVRVLTGDISISVTPNEKTTNFASMLPDYKNVLRAPFCKWAENALPSEYDKTHTVLIRVAQLFSQSMRDYLMLWLATKNM
jgi:hypothetical protein